MHALPHRRRCHTEGPRHILGRQFFEIAQYERVSIQIGQPRNDLACLLGEELPIQQFVCARRDLQFNGRGDMGPLRIEPWQKHLDRLGRVPRSRATLHERRVARDPIQPGSKLRLPAKRRQVTIDLQKRFLQHVGRVSLAGETACQAKDPRLVPSHDRFERGVVPCRRSRGERFIARLRCGDDGTHRVYRLLIAAFTFAASSGDTSVMPWSCAAWAATAFKSSSSVAALAVKGQSGTIAAHAMYLSFSVSAAGMLILLQDFGFALEMPARACM